MIVDLNNEENFEQKSSSPMKKLKSVSQERDESAKSKSKEKGFGEYNN